MSSTTEMIDTLLAKAMTLNKKVERLEAVKLRTDICEIIQRDPKDTSDSDILTTIREYEEFTNMNMDEWDVVQGVAHGGREHEDEIRRLQAENKKLKEENAYLETSVLTTTNYWQSTYTNAESEIEKLKAEIKDLKDSWGDIYDTAQESMVDDDDERIEHMLGCEHSERADAVEKLKEDYEKLKAEIEKLRVEIVPLEIDFNIKSFAERRQIRKIIQESLLACLDVLTPFRGWTIDDEDVPDMMKHKADDLCDKFKVSRMIGMTLMKELFEVKDGIMVLRDD